MSKKNKKAVKENLLLVGYEENYASGGMAINPEDNWPDYEDEYREFEIKGVWKTRENAPWMVESFNLDFDPEIGQNIFVLVVRYSSGSTFGKIFGCGYIEGVYKTIEEAEEVEKKIWNDSYKGYKPWVGYFESLEDVIIEECKIM